MTLHPKIIALEPEPNLTIGYTPWSFAEEDKPMYLNPCLQYLGEEYMDFVNGLDNQTKATPGKYYIPDKDEVDVVQLYVAKCPDGTIQNVKQGRCDERPGQSMEAICNKTNPLTEKSSVEMLKTHIDKIQSEQ